MAVLKSSKQTDALMLLLDIRSKHCSSFFSEGPVDISATFRCIQVSKYVPFKDASVL